MKAFENSNFSEDLGKETGVKIGLSVQLLAAAQSLCSHFNANYEGLIRLHFNVFCRKLHKKVLHGGA